MHKAIRLFFLLFFAFLFHSTLHATHNRAGEITYVQTGPTSIVATITTYTRASSIPADRDSLEICWGDGKCEWVRRVNGPVGPGGIPQGEILPNDTKRNFYIADHTYPFLRRYTIWMTDPNRNAGICNVNAPNSDNVPFHIQTTVTLFNQQFNGPNSSPVLEQPPIDIACVGQPFEHNPNAYDPDGDSLSYELMVPMQDLNSNVPNYKYPNQIMPLNNILTLDPVTGDLLWDAPQQPCEYNIAIRIIQYRNGFPIDTLIRDMQILVLECENLPPRVETIEEICVVAGETVEFDVIATDPDVDPVQKIELTALGGPFIVPFSPAQFSAPTGYQTHPVLGTFIWNTKCEHISDQYYTVVFKAVDNHPIPLADLKTVRIKVVGPPPEDLLAETEQGRIEVSWALPYACENAANEYFRGFSIWRRLGSNQFDIDSCVTGLEGRGYTRLQRSLFDVKDGRYFYVDEDVERGRTYCYRVLGEFAKLSAQNYPFNEVESLPSAEICIQLSRDIPLLTNVDVQRTDPTDGRIFVRWTKPVAEDLDTLQNGGPYRYQLSRATGFGGTFQPIPGASWSSPTFAGANDTTYIDSTGLNTLETPYTYRVSFFVENEPEPLGSIDASSVFLSSAPTDNANVLSWEAEVPWQNIRHVVYRKLPGGTTFDSLTTVSEFTYTDRGLVNGQEYCYYVTTIGTYGLDGVDSLLFNRSQELCSVPVDNVPPCPPILNVTNECPTASPTASEEDFINRLAWDDPNLRCEDTDDVVGYKVYYAEGPDAEFQLLESINFLKDPVSWSPEDTTYFHNTLLGLAGCYAVTAVDSFDNESVRSNVVCVDNCPVYELPNVFTPNGDGQNDLFIPFPYRYVDRIEIQIFNRWGGLVFETNDPDINWDGTNLNGDLLNEGTYFYKCTVFERRLNGEIESPDLLQGYIELITGE
jgi:gliding motility-associated-like protein